MDKLLTFSTDADSLPGFQRDWLVAAQGSLVCSECGGVLRSYYPNPVDVHLREQLSEFPENMSCGQISGSGSKTKAKLDLFATSFLGAIREHLSGFVIGRCFDSEGVLIPTHATCYTRDRIMTHADEGARYWTCSACSDTWSYIPPAVPRYVLRSDLGEAMVYQDDLTRLFIADTVARTIDWTQWPDLDLEWVEIRDSSTSNGNKGC